MAFPYIYSASFDTGDATEWSGGETDTGALLDFPHYTDLAAIPGASAPYRGAYCMRIQPGDTNDHTVLEAAIDIADAATAFVRFALYISTDFAATADDDFNIFEWQQTDGTVEASMGLRITASTDEVTIGVGDGTAPAAYPGVLLKGVWHVIEASLLVSTGGTGTMELFIDGASVQSLTSQTHAAAVGQGVLGTQDTLATTDTGFLLFDEFAFDDTRLGITQRFHTHRMITTSSFLFVGPGRIENIKLLDGGSGNVLVEVYDTDVYSASLTPIWIDRTATNNVNVDAADMPVEFSRGCLAILAGTLPGASFTIGRASGWGSEGAIRTYAGKRVPAPGDI